MEFITVRDLRLRPGEVWRKLRERGELVLTSNGRPVAVITGVNEGELEQTLAALRRARAQVAVSRLRRIAEERGLQRMSAEEIEAEIAQARRERSASSGEAEGACASS
jgi:prevent-host-death family protein